MKRELRGIAIWILITFMITTAFASGTLKSIDVLINSVNLEVNGQGVEADTILYKGTTYVPLRAAAEMLGKEVGYNSKTRTASINKKEETCTNKIVNPSVEIFNDGGLPNNWSKGAWGEDLSCDFSYYKYGRTGDRSLRIDIDSYGLNGDAKWYHEPIEVKAGEWYEFSNYYRSDVLTTVTIKQLHKDGTLSYFDLANVSPSPDKWKKFSRAFYVNENIKEITAYHLIRNEGYLITDDYHLDLYTPQAFDRALLTLTFDDGWQENYETALPIMGQYEVKSTQAFATKYINQNNNEDINKIKLFIENGHEIESHSVNHYNMTELTDEEILYELQESQSFLRQLFPDQSVNNFFSPFGVYNDKILNMVHELYDSHRSTDVGFNSKDNFDVYNVRVQNVLSTTTANQIKIWVDEAMKTSTWLVLVYHRVTNDPGYYDSFEDDFLQHIEVISDSGITVLTYSEALKEITDQIRKE